MSQTNKRAEDRVRRHRRIRKKVVGMPDRPRVSLFRSHKHLYAQVIDDVAGKTLVGASTKGQQLKLERGGNIAAAEQLGKWMGEEAVKRGIQQVVFDRGGYPYHGRVKAFAEALRASGVKV